MFAVSCLCSNLTNLIFKVPEMLHSVPGPEVFRRRQQTQVVWDQYLSSVEKIVLTTLTIIQVNNLPEGSDKTKNKALLLYESFK